MSVPYDYCQASLNETVENRAGETPSLFNCRRASNTKYFSSLTLCRIHRFLLTSSNFTVVATAQIRVEALWLLLLQVHTVALSPKIELPLFLASLSDVNYYATMALVSAMAYKAVEQMKLPNTFDPANETTCRAGSFLKVDASANPLSASVPPLARYNGKLMNSIWGLYNMYAPHAFQKNTELAPGATQTSVAQNGSSTRLGLLGHH